MNRLIIMILITVGFMGCGSRDEKTASKEMNQTIDSTAIQSKEHEATKKEDEDELDNGAKWKLDEKTRENIGLMRLSLKDSAGSASIIPRLRQQTDKLVSDCRMEGKAHEVLHHWLNEFLEHLEKAGKSGGTMKEQEVNRLKKDMEEFDRLFE